MCEYLFFMVILSVFMQQKYFTASNCALCWSALHQQRAKNGWLMTYCTHLPALVVTSETQTTARQNGIVHLQPYFFNFQLLIFNKADCEQTAVVLSFVCLKTFQSSLSSYDAYLLGSPLKGIADSRPPANRDYSPCSPLRHCEVPAFVSVHNLGNDSHFFLKQYTPLLLGSLCFANILLRNTT